MTVRDDMVNGHAMAHGGLIFTLADTAFACACNSFGPVTVAASAEIVFVAPARAGDVLVAEAVLRTRFGRAGLYDVTVRRDGDVIAEFRGRSHQLGAGLVSPGAAPGAGRPGAVLPAMLPLSTRPGAAPRTARLRPRVRAGGGRRAVQRARLRRYEHARPGGQARHRQVGDLPPRHGQGGTAQPGPGPGPGRPGGGDQPGPRAPRPGHRAPGVPRPGQRRGARSRVALRHPAAPGARQHRRRAGRAGQAARLRPVRGRTGGRGRAGR